MVPLVGAALASGLISGATSIFGGRQAQSAANAQAAANMKYERENMQYQNQFNLDAAREAQSWNASQALAVRDWEADQAGIARTWNAEQFAQERSFNAGEAEKNRAFQQYNSDTQYQRAVGDMKAAGLNPMLAYAQGGAGNVGGSTASASAPSTSAPSASAPQGGQASSGGGARASMQNFQNYIGQGMSTALQALSTLTGVEQAEAATKEIQARTITQVAEAERVKSQAELNSAERARVDQTVRELLWDWDRGYKPTRLRNQTDREGYETRTSQNRSNISEEEYRQSRYDTDYKGLEGAERRGTAAFHELLNRNLEGGSSSARGLKELIEFGLTRSMGLMRGLK